MCIFSFSRSLVSTLKKSSYLHIIIIILNFYSSFVKIIKRFDVFSGDFPSTTLCFFFVVVAIVSHTIRSTVSLVRETMSYVEYTGV